MGNIAAHKVDQLPGEQGKKLPAIGLQFAEADRDRRVLAQQAQAFDVLRMDRVFEKEQFVLLQGLRQPRRLNRIQPMVNVVDEQRFAAEGDAQMLEDGRKFLKISVGFPALWRGRVPVRQIAGGETIPVRANVVRLPGRRRDLQAQRRGRCTAPGRAADQSFPRSGAG